jgi:hypothetical protein
MRLRAREDANRPEIVEALKAYGWKIRAVKWPCDLLICRDGHLFCAEVKVDDKATLTLDQAALIVDGFPFVRLETADDVDRLTRQIIRT